MRFVLLVAGQPVGQAEGDASSPPTRRPVSNRSAAAWCPTAAGRVTDSAKPWWKPRRAKLALKRLGE